MNSSSVIRLELPKVYSTRRVFQFLHMGDYNYCFFDFMSQNIAIHLPFWTIRYTSLGLRLSMPSVLTQHRTTDENQQS